MSKSGNDDSGTKDADRSILTVSSTIADGNTKSDLDIDLDEDEHKIERQESYSSLRNETKKNIADYSSYINDVLPSSGLLSNKLPIKLYSDDLIDKLKDGIILGLILNQIKQNSVKIPEKVSSNIHLWNVTNTSVIIALRRTGIKLAGTQASDISSGNRIRILGLLWQLILKHLEKTTVIQIKPTPDVEFLSHEDLLLKWFNEMLSNAGYDKFITNFDEDLKDGDRYIVLLSQLEPKQFSQEMIKEPSIEKKLNLFLGILGKIGIDLFIDKKSIQEGNKEKNIAFISYLYKKYFKLPEPEIPEPIALPQVESVFVVDTPEQNLINQALNQNETKVNLIKKDIENLQDKMKQETESTSKDTEKNLLQAAYIRTVIRDKQYELNKIAQENLELERKKKFEAKKLVFQKKTENERLQEEIKLLEEKEAEKKRIMELKDYTDAQIQAMTQNVETETKLIENQAASIEQNINQARDEYNQLKEENLEYIAEIEKMDEQIESEKKKFDKKKKAVIERMEAANLPEIEKKIEEAVQTNESLRVEIREKKQEIVETQQKIDALGVENNMKIKDIKQKEVEVEKLVVEENDLKQTEVKLRQKIELNQKKLLFLVEEEKLGKKNTEEVKWERELLENEIDTIQDDLESTTLEISSIIQLKAQEEDRLENYKEELEEVKMQRALKEQALFAELEAQRTRMEMTKQHEENLKRIQMEKNSEMIAQSMEEEMRMDKEIQEIEKKLKEMKLKKESINIDIMEIDTQIEENEESIQDLEKEVKLIEQKAKNQRKAREDAKKQAKKKALQLQSVIGTDLSSLEQEQLEFEMMLNDSRKRSSYTAPIDDDLGSLVAADQGTRKKKTKLTSESIADDLLNFNIDLDRKKSSKTKKKTKTMK